MKSLLFNSAFGIGLMASAVADDAPQKVTWDDMKAEYKFEDPFIKLRSEQLLNLSMVARVRQLEIRGKKNGKPVSEEMVKEKMASEKLLIDQSIDIDGLLAKRDEIKELRKKRANLGVEKLNGKLVTLSGFVLPLEFEDKKVKEFLLVPWVGACIHTPPPPPNQIALVVVTTPFESKGMFEAVTVTGKIQLKTQLQELFLVDGKADINVSYSFEQAKVEKYKKPENSQ
ncbi:DUF3299 domain-containing protein [Rubritalea profundi]|uniref:DUF3299 domain-containing protein n=1 Tax=Rubritalea profundi TaxID=1658618 RepID=A0A2S7U1I5_9BACT|nr:DUF3299 domain-containing protein [Rubritalea profundi]PQJ28357.1 hypothetical protein BSZ32_07410 [Rubritalea profundi]